MNTLRVLKGKDVELAVNGESLCFVVEFSAKEIKDSYPITEFLSDTYVESVPLKPLYELNVTALSHLDSRVFEEDSFELSVMLSDQKYVYKNCSLTKKQKDVNEDKPIVDRYTITATQLEVTEVVYD